MIIAKYVQEKSIWSLTLDVLSIVEAMLFHFTIKTKPTRLLNYILKRKFKI